MSLPRNQIVALVCTAVSVILSALVGSGSGGSRRFVPAIAGSFPNDKALRLGLAKYLAAQHIAEGQFTLAVKVLSAAVEDFPNDIEILNQRASAYLKLAQWQAADADYARVIALEADDGRRRTAERAQAECKLREGQFQEAAEMFLQEMLLTPSDYYRIRDACVSLMFSRQSDIENVAVGRFYEKLKATTDASQARWLLRTVTARPGLITNENRGKLLELAKLTEGAWVAPNNAAIHYRSGDLNQAAPLLTTSKDKPQYEALAAMLLYDQGKADEARALLKASWGKWYETERAKDPHSTIPAQRSWQEWYLDLAVWREAARKLAGPRLAEIDKLLAREPDRIPELLERAQLLAGAGLHEEAIKDVDWLIALKVATPEAQALHGRILAGMNRYEEALLQLNLAIEAGSQDPSVYFGAPFS